MWYLRRDFLTGLAATVATLLDRATAAPDPSRSAFVDQAFKMKKQAIESGDQPFGAVVVRGREVVGFGPSRVVLKRDETAHAEREAIRDAQARLGRSDLADCVMYSTSRPCRDCERTAASAKISRMYVGADAADAGAPSYMP
jgi:tRNA(Arg) A34 adenosine deaminase TadA